MFRSEIWCPNGSTTAPRKCSPIRYTRISTNAAERAAELVTKNRHDKYKEIKANNYLFDVKKMGTWSSETLSLANKIGLMLIERSGDRRAKYYLFQRISVAIQRDNAACTMVDSPKHI